MTRRRTTIDRDTRDAIRTPLDEKWAEKHGARFEPARAAHFADFCSTELRLWEGDNAGQPFHLLPWQKIVTDRLFGWTIPDPARGRRVRRFRRSIVFVPKKNGKSPLAAAIGLYLFARDGEPGQNVFSVARDGVQARIMHRHAVRMALASPSLSREITHSKQTLRLTHPATNSTYSVLAADNFLSAEGINGCILLDETHVVDARLALVLADAGASRSEPVHFEISTAGNDPTSYGRAQCEYGRAVLKGDIDDGQTDYHEWGAPEDATDQDCQSEKFWRQANPAYGQTISPTEFRQTAARAQRSLTDWAGFKQRRLNIWQKTAATWLRPASWQACEAPDLKLAHLAGLNAAIGLDLSRVNDFTAATFAATVDGLLAIVPYFWLPEARAEEIGHLVPVRDWHAQGAIKICPGDVIDFADLLEDLQDLVRVARPRLLVYDPLFAEDITQRLVAATRLQRVTFTQTFKSYTPPVADLTRAILDGKLLHPDNPCLNWQVGNVLMKTIGDNSKPLKDYRTPWKTIDGVQAACMALAGLAAGPPPSKYAARDLITI